MNSPIQPETPCLADSGLPANPYDRVFFTAYGANIALMTAMSLLFRYSDFVVVLGGSELHLGWIVGVGMVGAILLRLVQGLAIDRFGTRLVWLVSLVVLLVGLLAHTQIQSIDGISVYLARFLVASGFAGALGSWVTFISLRAPAHRIAELIGVGGSSGFVGMAFGPTIGDLIFSTADPNSLQVGRMFGVAAVLVLASLCCATLATRGRTRRLPHVVGRPLKLVRQFHPGFLVVVAVVMGFGGNLPSTFLRPFAQSLGIAQIAMFFWTYNAIAFTARLVFRRAPDVIGLSWMIIIGLVCLGLSMPLYLAVTDATLLFLPAVFSGIAHAFLFPAVMAKGSGSFPIENRGFAMNLMFALYDVGLLVGSPIVGWLLISTRRAGLPDYPTVFLALAVVMFVVAAVYYAKYLFAMRRVP